LFDRHQYNLRRQVEREIKYASKKGYKFPVSVPASVMANNWLLYRYGIGPAIRLLNDTLVVGSKIRTYRRTSRGFETREGQEVTTYPQQVGTFFYVDQKATLNWSASVRAGILYEYKNFNNKYGFSLSAVPEATWNVIPWSFVVDWFANTGTFISALTPRYSSDRRATWIGHELVADVLYETFLTWRNLANHQLVQAQTGAAMQRFVHRRRSPGLPAPTLAIREEALSEIKNSRRAVDAFALTWQLLQKLMRRS
jgi:hypothetical protein